MDIVNNFHATTYQLSELVISSNHVFPTKKETNTGQEKTVKVIRRSFKHQCVLFAEVQALITNPLFHISTWTSINDMLRLKRYKNGTELLICSWQPSPFPFQITKMPLCQKFMSKILQHSLTDFFFWHPTHKALCWRGTTRRVHPQCDHCS